MRLNNEVFYETYLSSRDAVGAKAGSWGWHGNHLDARLERWRKSIWNVSIGTARVRDRLEVRRVVANACAGAGIDPGSDRHTGHRCAGRGRDPPVDNRGRATDIAEGLFLGKQETTCEQKPSAAEEGEPRERYCTQLDHGSVNESSPAAGRWKGTMCSHSLASDRATIATTGSEGLRLNTS
jgi:hypothetical protein